MFHWQFYIFQYWEIKRSTGFNLHRRDTLTELMFTYTGVVVKGKGQGPPLQK